MEVLEKIAKTLSRNYGINLTFKGTQAKTDGKRIILPSLPENLSPEMKTKIRGYCDHEIGHVRFTNNKYKLGLDRKVGYLANLLEDFRIEKLMGSEYRGCKANMEKLAQLLMSEDKADPDHIMNKLWLEGRRHVCGYELKGKDYIADLEEVFGKGIIEKLKGMESSMDARNLAQELFDRIQEPPDPETEDRPGDNNKGDKSQDSSDQPDQESTDSPEKIDEDQEKDPGDDAAEESQDGSENEKDSGNEEGDQGESSNGKESEGSGDEDQEGEDQKGDSGDGESSDDVQDDKSPDSKDMGGSDEAPDSDEVTRSTSEDGDNEEGNDEIEKGAKREERIKELMDELDDWENPSETVSKDIEGAAREGGDKYTVYSKEFDILKPFDGDYPRGYTNLRNSLGPLNSIKNKMASMFLARTASRWYGGQERGRLDARALASVPAGNRMVFRKKVISRERDTAVTFLIDWSGSMAGSRIKDAMRATTLFLESLSRTPVKCEALAYTTKLYPYKFENKNWHEINHSGISFGRVEALVTYILKAFDEPLNRTVKGRIGAYTKADLRENCDPENVKIAWQRLKARKEKRKILFVLSDGAVANQGDTYIGKKYLKEVCEMIYRDGDVELVGIGMDCSVKHYYKNSVSVRGSDLTNEMYRQLKNVLKV